MNETQFCYWLQGFFELSGKSELTPLQVEMIKDHLSLVFKKETPNRINSNGLLYCSPTQELKIGKELKESIDKVLKPHLEVMEALGYPPNYSDWRPVYREDVKDLGMEKYLPNIECPFVYIKKDQLDPNIRNYPITC